jgi:peptidase E
MNNAATTKIHERIKTTCDKAFELVKVGSGNTKELLHVANFFYLEGI